MRGLRVTLFLAALSAACGSGDMDSTDARLIPPADPDFEELEAPEQAAECTFDDECEVSCLWSCVPSDQGPMTCPEPPLSEPARLEGAACLCSGEVCAYLE